MGICASCESTAVAATAKLILQDGRLQEFSYPVKVSYVLSKDPNCFICNSDEMEFNVVVSAVRDDEELQPGQLYFALPLSKLQRPLHAEEMAALAVKANAALLSRARRHKCKTPVGFFGGDRSHKVAQSVVKSVGRNRNRTRNGRGKTYAANLSIIPE